MDIKVKFAFVCTTILGIFAGGSVLMSLVSTGAKAINEDVSSLAASYSSTFLQATFLFAILIVIAILVENKSHSW